MIAEVNKAKKYLFDRFGTGYIPVGDYAVPTDTSRGEAFMKVTINEQGYMHGFYLYWDEALTQDWYKTNKDGISRIN